jgi:hypothetical protein
MFQLMILFCGVASSNTGCYIKPASPTLRFSTEGTCERFLRQGAFLGEAYVLMWCAPVPQAPERR